MKNIKSFHLPGTAMKYCSIDCWNRVIYCCGGKTVTLSLAPRRVVLPLDSIRLYHVYAPMKSIIPETIGVNIRINLEIERAEVVSSREHTHNADNQFFALIIDSNEQRIVHDICPGQKLCIIQKRFPNDLLWVWVNQQQSLVSPFNEITVPQCGRSATATAISISFVVCADFWSCMPILNSLQVEGLHRKRKKRTKGQ